MVSEAGIKGETGIVTVYARSLPPLTSTQSMPSEEMHFSNLRHTYICTFAGAELHFVAVLSLRFLDRIQLSP